MHIPCFRGLENLGSYCQIKGTDVQSVVQVCFLPKPEVQFAPPTPLPHLNLNWVYSKTCIFAGDFADIKQSSIFSEKLGDNFPDQTRKEKVEWTHEITWCLPPKQKPYQPNLYHTEGQSHCNGGQYYLSQQMLIIISPGNCYFEFTQ